MVVTISHAGYIKRTPPSTYRAQKRGGKGKVGHGGARARTWSTSSSSPRRTRTSSSSATRGRSTSRRSTRSRSQRATPRGAPSSTSSGWSRARRSRPSRRCRRSKAGTFIVTLTERGQIKKTEVTEYENFREKGIIGVKIEDGDQLLGAALTDGTREIVIATKQGMSIRFAEKQVRPMGRATVGVKGIDIAEGDQVVGFASRTRPIRKCSPSAKRATASARRSTSSARRTAAARASSSSTRASATARSWASRSCTRRRGHARHRPRPDAPHQGERDPRDRPQRAGRAADERRGGRARRGHRRRRRVG